MVESAVYICGWSQTADGFELWVKSRPHVRARGRTCVEAEDALIEAIIKNGGAFHAVMEFVPPLPKSDLERKYCSPEVFAVCGDEGFDALHPRRIPFKTEAECIEREAWYDNFFTAPCCRSCLKPAGPRNERRIQATAIRSGYDGGFCCFAGAHVNIFSEAFLGLLSADERKGLHFQRVERPRRSRKQFFELLGPAGPADVAAKGLKLDGWQCGTCGIRVFGQHFEQDNHLSHFVARSDLRAPLPHVFTIGPHYDLRLCITAERWASLVGRPGTRGIISSPVGIVPDDELIREPELGPPKPWPSRHDSA